MLRVSPKMLKLKDTFAPLSACVSIHTCEWVYACALFAEELTFP